ncbi:hypothetical protein AB6A40_007677 [Gnathostoma spinigerum]|uniref:Uncharacterized protein n=1 Tax=Gnathostoma spinigerum TaxID=75299 RepID=A0ABD6EV84_9BILA
MVKASGASVDGKVKEAKKGKNEKKLDATPKRVKAKAVVGLQKRSKTNINAHDGQMTAETTFRKPSQPTGQHGKIRELHPLSVHHPVIPDPPTTNTQLSFTEGTSSFSESSTQIAFPRKGTKTVMKLEEIMKEERTQSRRATISTKTAKQKS